MVDFNSKELESYFENKEKYLRFAEKLLETSATHIKSEMYTE